MSDVSDVTDDLADNTSGDVTGDVSTAPDRPVRCVECGRAGAWDTFRGVVVMRRHPAHPGPECLGTGIPPVGAPAGGDSGKCGPSVDGFRRFALAKTWERQHEAAENWDLAVKQVMPRDGWRLATLVQINTPVVVRNQAAARLWHRTAFYGDYVAAFVEAVEEMVTVETESRDVDRALTEMTRAGVRDWIREARTDLINAAPDGLSVVQLAALVAVF